MNWAGAIAIVKVAALFSPPSIGIVYTKKVELE
jgi:hypothetical protein